MEDSKRTTHDADDDLRNRDIKIYVNGEIVHRDSLLNRIERIAGITGLDLDDADDRFSLQLALKLRAFLAAACPGKERPTTRGRRRST